MDLLPSLPLLAVFSATSLALAIAPGPGVFFIVAQTMGHGRRAGLVSVAGVAAGNLGSVIATALGLGALLLASSSAFFVVKWIGAAYLIYLGLKTLLSHRPEAELAKPERISPRRLFHEGLLVALLNPKTAIFFAAFLPQFMVSEGSAGIQALLLGSIFVAIAALTDTVYAIAASSAASAWSRSSLLRHSGSMFTGATFIGLGVFAAMSDTRRTN